MEIQANDVIEGLANDISRYAKENAVLKAQIKLLSDKIADLQVELDEKSN